MISDTILEKIKLFAQPLGTDIFCLGRKFLVFNLVSRNLKTKYRRSIFGILWTLLTPVAMTAVYYFVFKVVLRVQIPNHLVFILSGVLHWNFISQSIMEGMESIVGAMGLVTKVPIPLSVFPFVGTLTNFITLGLSMPVLLGAALLFGAPISTSVILLPYYALVLYLIVYGVSSILAVLFVIFRDLRHILSIVMSIWFYATPVIYDEKMIPVKYGWVLYLNPFGVFFSDLHTIWVRGEWPSLVHLGLVTGWASVSICGAVLVFSYFSEGLVEQL